MSGGGPSGFHNTPVTKVFVVTSTVLTIVLGIRGRSSVIGLSRKIIFKNFQIWKLFSSFFAFSSTPELVFGIYLIYYFRVFERQIGSNKHSVFVLFSTTVSSLLQVLALSLIKDFGLDILAPGPYGLIFSSFVPFFFDIPVSSRFRVFGINFSDKSLTYLAGLQLLFSSWKRSFLPGVCGILAGSLYRLNLFGIRRAKIPKFIASFFSKLFPSGGTSRVAPSGNARNPNILRNQQLPFGGNQREARLNPINIAVTEPPQDSIATLVSMGFDVSSARQALMRAHNDINVATNILLEMQSH
ncbi:Ubiquitin-associated /TS-N domain-containing protein [Zostera marina]|uniref:Ubiquitin-associated /TS-N domain-containing protein n=1 Tax=Zostera marina TaxID=29655 RepID=A0A0K9PPI0_ZOSMR|nr:Ubiquitin-associated /TS-N domain-containing protein [Zostera marina]